MERWTKRTDDGVLLSEEHEEKYTLIELIDILLERLAAYEDTGLEPEYITELLADANAMVKELKELRDLAQAQKDGQYIKLPFVAMVEQSLKGGKMTPQKDQSHNGRYALVYSDPKKWKSPLIDICGKHYDREEAETRMEELRGGADHEKK